MPREGLHDFSPGSSTRTPPSPRTGPTAISSGCSDAAHGPAHDALSVRHADALRRAEPPADAGVARRAAGARLDGGGPGRGLRGGVRRRRRGDDDDAAGAGQRIAVEVAGTVETGDTAGALRGQRRRFAEALPALHGSDPIEPGAGRAGDAALAGAPGDDLGRAHALAAAVAEAITYGAGATEATTTAAEALALGRGVCQDMAQALIAAAQGAGLPARYVTGYLLGRRRGRGRRRRPRLGRGPRRGPRLGRLRSRQPLLPDERYVRLDSGRDAREAAPIRGWRAAAGPRR